MATTTTGNNIFHCCCYPSISSIGGSELPRNLRWNLTIHKNLFKHNYSRPKLSVVRCTGEDSSEGPKKPRKPRVRKSADAQGGTDAPKTKKTRKKVTEVGTEAPKVKKTRKKVPEVDDGGGKIQKEIPKTSRPRKKKEPQATGKVSEETTKLAFSQATGSKEKTSEVSEKKTELAKTKPVPTPKKTSLPAMLETTYDGKILRGPSWLVTLMNDEDESEYEDEDEEEEEEEDEVEVEEDYEDENKPIEPKFPDKDCYALVSSYKKLEKPPSLPNDKLWWNWQRSNPEDHVWSEFQRREGEAETTLAAMAALTGQIKLFGDTPSVAETTLYRARKFVFQEERLAAEEKRKFEIGPLAYYSEWVKAWDKDTSREAVQKHFEETGENEDVQLQIMLCHQTRAEFRHMMGTDMRIRRDPLVMRATEEMKKTVYGGDPVYPTINYIRDPDEIADWRGPNCHEPRMSPVAYLKKCGVMKTRAQHNELMALEQLEAEEEEALLSDDEELIGDEELAAAVDIGEKDMVVNLYRFISLLANVSAQDEVEDEEDDVEALEEEEAVLEEEEEALKDDNIEVVPTSKLAELLTDEDEVVE